MKKEELLTMRQLAQVLDTCKTTAHTWSGRYTLSKYLTTTIEGKRNVKFKLNNESYKEFMKFLKATNNTKSELALRQYWEGPKKPEPFIASKCPALEIDGCTCLDKRNDRLLCKDTNDCAIKRIITLVEMGNGNLEEKNITAYQLKRKLTKINNQILNLLQDKEVILE